MHPWDRVRTLAIDRAPRPWVLWAASRPSQLALVLLLYGLGLGMALSGPPVATHAPAIDPSRAGLGGSFPAGALVGLLVLVPVAVTIHYTNEFADLDTDAISDRTPFSGGSGALVETGVPRRFLGVAVLGTGTLATGAIALTVTRGWLPTDAAGLATVGLVLGVAYSLQPVALIRRGVGEVVNAVLGGLAIAVYGVMVVAGATIGTWAAMLPFALVVGCSLLSTHWPDRAPDAHVGKRTLVVRWSPARIRRAYALLAVGAALTVVALWTAGTLPVPVVLGHLSAAPFLLWGWTTLTRRRNPLPSVLAMVVLALSLTATWWWVGLAAVG